MIRSAKYTYTNPEQSLQCTPIKKVLGLCCIFILLAVTANLGSAGIKAQVTSTMVTDSAPADPEKTHSPRKATIYALVLPGAGQVYNHKYWKLPIVYAGFGACIYFIVTNTRYYNELNDAYKYASVTVKTIYPPTPVNYFPYPAPPNDWAKNYTESQLKDGRDTYRRYLEISYIATGVWYLLTVVDATVDAHFFDYDINEDLTLNVTPWIPSLDLNTAHNLSGGINLTLRF